VEAVAGGGGAQACRNLLITCGWFSLLAARNGPETSIGATFGRVGLATMASQQAVAKRSVGRRVNLSTCLFFIFSTAFEAPCLAPRNKPLLTRLRRVVRPQATA
jgi:hypothetical protein